MTKLEQALYASKTAQGTKIDIQNIRRLSISIITNAEYFELLSWEASSGAKTYKIQLPLKYLDEIFNDIKSYKIKEEEGIIDIFEDKSKAGWGR